MNLKRVISMILLCLMFSSVTVQAEVNKENLKSRVILSSYEIVGDVASPGKQVTLNMTFSNKNPYKDVYSILISFSSDKNSIYPVYGQSNQVYIEKIKAKSEETVSVDFLLSQTIDKDLIPLQLDISYVDKTDEAGSNVAGILLPITHVNKLQVRSVSVTDNNTLGARTIVGIKYENIGLTDLQNIELMIEGDILENQESINLGKLAAGKSQYSETSINFQKEGEQTVRITMKYEDQDGTAYACPEQEYTVNVKSGVTNKTQDMNYEFNNSALDTSLSNIFLIAGCGMLILILFVIILVKGKKRKDVRYE
jgi:hypothetical protein